MSPRNLACGVFLVLVVLGMLLVYRVGEKRAPATPIGAKLEIKSKS